MTSATTAHKVGQSTVSALELNGRTLTLCSVPDFGGQQVTLVGSVLVVVDTGCADGNELLALAWLRSQELHSPAHPGGGVFL